MGIQKKSPNILVMEIISPQYLNQVDGNDEGCLSCLHLPPPEHHAVGTNL